MLDVLQEDDSLIVTISTRDGTEIHVCMFDHMEYWNFVSQFAIGRRYDIGRKEIFSQRIARISEIIAEAPNKAAEEQAERLARAFSAYEGEHMPSFHVETSMGASAGFPQEVDNERNFQ